MPTNGVDEVAFASDHAEERVVVTTDPLRGGVEDDVDTVAERTLDGEGVEVDHGDGAGDGAHRIEVDEIESWVGRRLDEHERVRPGRTAAAISSTSVPSTKVTSIPKRQCIVNGAEVTEKTWRWATT